MSKIKDSWESFKKSKFAINMVKLFEFCDRHEIKFTWFFFIFFSMCLVLYYVKPPENISKFHSTLVYLLPTYELGCLIYYYYHKWKDKKKVDTKS